MQLLLKSPTHTITTSEAAREIYDDAQYRAEITHIVSDINAKLPSKTIKRTGRDVNHEPHSSMYRLYLRGESDS